MLNIKIQSLNLSRKLRSAPFNIVAFPDIIVTLYFIFPSSNVVSFPHEKQSTQQLGSLDYGGPESSRRCSFRKNMQMDKNTNIFKWKQTTSRLSSHTEFPCGITVGAADAKTA